MVFDAGRNLMAPSSPFWEPRHDIQQRLSRGTWRRLYLNGSKFRNDFIMYCDLNAGPCVALDAAHQRRQPLARFTDRKFHDDLRLNMLEMYNHVQCLSTRRQLRHAVRRGKQVM